MNLDASPTPAASPPAVRKGSAFPGHGVLLWRRLRLDRQNGHHIQRFALPGYSLVDHHSNVMLLTSESVFMQRVNYIHQNPVRAGLVARAGGVEPCMMSRC